MSPEPSLDRLSDVADSLGTSFETFESSARRARLTDSFKGSSNRLVQEAYPFNLSPINAVLVKGCSVNAGHVFLRNT